MTATDCPNCGKPAEGKFCQHCGARLAPGFCTRCGSPLTPGSRFCPQCGSGREEAGPGPAPAAGSGSGPAGPNWLVPAGILVVAVVVALVFLVRINGGSAQSGTGAGSAAVAGAALPDLSQMSPRERFDRLYNRVMQAAESGDAATMQQFTPMAIAAYGMLPEVDADARYHVALLMLHSGDVDGSRAVADSILADSPDHLFGLILLGTIAKWQNDSAGLAEAYRRFLAAYDAEMAAARPEYDEHRPAIQGFLGDARAAVGGPGGAAVPGSSGGAGSE